MSLPDAALMTQLRDRNSGALEALYDRYSRPVYSLVLRISQQATAAKIVQDVFLHLWRHADRYDASRGPLSRGCLPWRETALSTFWAQKRKTAAARGRV